MVRVLNVANESANLHKLIEDVTVSREPLIISGKDSNAVLLAEDDWILINETLNLLSVPSMRESIAKGMTQSIEKCASELDW